MPDWLTPEGVATYLGDAALADDPNLESVCNGLEVYLEGQRRDVFAAPNPVAPADLVLGATMWAAHVFQVRSGPAGFSGYGDGAGDAMFDLSYASNRSDIWRLCGLKKPVAW